MSIKIILLGAPGSGKGSISNVLKEEHNFVHLSTGDIFRKQLNTDSKYRDELKIIMMSGQLVSDELTNNIIKDEILELCRKKCNIILDGYPRNINQAKFLFELIEVDYAFNITVDRDILVKRIFGRLTCPTCKAIYNNFFKKPKVEGICDFDGSLLVQRSDDNAETAEKRIEIFEQENKKIVEFYENLGILVNIENTNLSEAVSQIIDACKK